MKKLLITGAGGLLGQYLCKYFAKQYSVIGTQFSVQVPPSAFAAVAVDLSDLSQTKALIEKYQPDFIVHTVALSSVDECETSPEKAFEVNVTTTKNLLQSLQGTNTKFIQISTDHLFDGEKSFYTELSSPHPLNAYARTKLDAEEKALKYPNSLVLRTNFYGGHTVRKPSFSTWIIQELMKEKTITMFDDSFFTPISIEGLAQNIELLLSSNLTGLYNIASAERLSKYEFALQLAEIFHLRSDLIKPVRMAELKLKALRPRDMSLSIEKIQRDLPSYEAETIKAGLLKIKNNQLI